MIFGVHFNPDTFPNGPELIARLREQNIDVVPIVDPGIKKMLIIPYIKKESSIIISAVNLKVRFIMVMFGQESVLSGFPKYDCSTLVGRFASVLHRLRHSRDLE